MGIYRSILEEDETLGGVLDDDNNMDMAEIDKVVDDHDANADEQTEAQDAEFGPTDGVDDIMDETAMAIAEAEMNFNSIMMAIGVHEISEAAAGRDVLYENALTDYFKKAKEWVVNFFKKVWSVLKRYASNIASVFHTNKGLADKKATEIEKGYNDYLKDKGEDHLKLWQFPGLDNFLNEKYWTDITLKIPTAGDLTVSDVDEDRKAFRKKICGSDDDDFRGALKDKIYGKEKVEKLISGSDVIKALKSGDEVKKVKKAMDTSKKQYKEAIAKFNEMEKKLTKAAGKENAAEDANDKMSAAVKATQVVKNQLADLQVVRAVTLSAARARMVQARSLAHVYIGAYNKSKDKGYRGKLKNESFGFLSGIELI